MNAIYIPEVTPKTSALMYFQLMFSWLNSKKPDLAFRSWQWSAIFQVSDPYQELTKHSSAGKIRKYKTSLDYLWEFVSWEEPQ